MRRINFILVLSIIALIGMIISSWPVFQNILGLARVILAPASSTLIQESSRSSGLFSTFSEIKDLATENQALKQQINQLESERLSFQEIVRENEALKKEIGIVEQVPQGQLAIAKIIGRSPSSFNQTIYINIGEDKGLKIGDPVLSQGFMIGRVEKVNKYTSQVMLTANHRFFIPVILAQSRALGLLRGGLQGLIVEQIPADIEIKPGEAVLASELIPSGLSSSVAGPSNLYLGKVDKILSRESDIFQTVSIELPFEIGELETVLIYQTL